MGQQVELEELYPEEAMHPVAVLDEQEDGCTMEQQVDQGLCLCLCPCLCLCLYLCPSEEGEEVQPVALPNEQEDADIEVVVEQGMDSH